MVRSEPPDRLWVAGRPDLPPWGILGGIHGDEPEGASVVGGLIAAGMGAADGRATWFGIGNPRALALGRRSLDPTGDLNRVFDRIEDRQPGAGARAALGPDLERASSLLDDLRRLDRLLDLHSTRLPGPTMAVIPMDDAHVRLATLLGAELLVFGAEAFLGRGMAVDVVRRRGGLGVLLECGPSGAAGTREAARMAVARYLGWAPPSTTSPRRVAIQEQLVVRSDVRRFAVTAESGTSVRKGEQLAECEVGSVRAPGDGVILLPRPKAKAGEPLAFFAEWV